MMPFQFKFHIFYFIISKYQTTLST
jgi:hypothetical protein